MQWNNHWHLEGKHAFLGASKYHWIRYDEEKIKESFNKFEAVQRGTRLHALASEHIQLGIKMPKTKQTFNQFINDSIGYKMESEKVLYYSDNCFGTADAISFRNKKLMIFDLKTGEIPAHMEQLLIYAALFCLEYHIKPGDIEIELRIYQSDDILCCKPTAEDVLPIMDKIITFDKIINSIKEEN